MHPVALSLIIAVAATALDAIIALPLAHAFARRGFRGKSAIETLLTLPLVLPPTVVGYAIVMCGGSRGVLGSWLSETWGYSILFRVEGAIIASAIVSFPLLYLPTKAAFRAIGTDLYENAELLGATRAQVLRYISLPNARHGILGGLVLCFARALGEFGATLIVFGWQPGKMTMPIAIYSAYEQGDPARAMPLVAVMTAICFALLLFYNRITRPDGD